MSREALILADIFDLEHMSRSPKRPQPYPRPWADLVRPARKGDAAGRTREEVIEILRRARLGELQEGAVEHG